MSDSEDEIFWGPVTIRELKIISEQLSPVDVPENTEPAVDSDLGSAYEEKKTVNVCYTPEGSSLSVNVDDKSSTERIESNGQNLQIQDDPLPKVTVPEIVISCVPSPEENSSTTATITTTSEEQISYNTTNDENCSVVMESLTHEQDYVLQTSNIPLQTRASECEPVESGLSNCEVLTCKCDSSEDDISCPKETKEASNDVSKQSDNMSNSILIIENESFSSNVSVGGSYNSIEVHHSSLQKTMGPCENDRECESDCSSLVNLHTLTNDKSVDTHFSGSVESAFFSNDYNTMHSKCTTSLNCIESHLEDTDNFNSIDDKICETKGNESGVVLHSLSDSEAISNVCNSIVLNSIADRDSQIVSERHDSNTSKRSSQEESKTSSKNNHLDSVFKNAVKDQSPIVNNVTKSTITFNSTPLRNVEHASKIPVLQPSPASYSCSSRKKACQVKTCLSECHGADCTECCASSHPFAIPVSPVSCVVNSDNLVTMSPGGDIIPTAFDVPNIHSSTNSVAANYVHVLKSEKISELSKFGFLKKSDCAEEKLLISSHRRQSSESDNSGGFNLDAVSSSVLCSSLSSPSQLDNSSNGNENSLNGTLEEMEMMMKHGFEYMCSTDDLSLKQDPEEGVLNNSLPVSVSKSESEQQIKPRGLERCQYIRACHEGIHPSVFRKELKEDIHVGSSKTPVLRVCPPKPTFASCPRPLQRLKKTVDFSNIRSPVGAYIKDRPVQLFKTAGKVKPFTRDDIPSQEAVVSVKQTLVTNVPRLPEIIYEKAPGINVNKSRPTERCGPAKKPYATPTVIRHAGRAVLATVPQNAVQIIKNAEVSVLYDKDVSKTTTI